MTKKNDRPSAAPSTPEAEPASPPRQGVGGAWRFMRSLGPIGVLALCWTAAPPLFSIALFAYMPTITNWLISHEGLAGFAYQASFALLAGIGVLPTYAQSGLGGYAFGWQAGIPLALSGFMGASVIGYYIARAVSGERAMKLITANPKALAVRDALVRDRPGLGGMLATIGMVALLRMPPNSPFALTNLAMAAAKVPLVPFVIGTVLGMAPRTAIAVFIGSLVQGTLTRDTLDKAAPAWVWYVGIAISLVIFVLIGRVAQRAVERATSSTPSA